MRFAKELFLTLCIVGYALPLTANDAALRAQGVNEHPAEVPADQRIYELYSWPVKDGWRFSLVPTQSGANATAAEVFNRKFLVGSPQELDRYFFTMRNGTEVVWHEKTLAGAGTRDRRASNLRYPPQNIIDRVRALAEAHKVQLSVAVPQKN